MWTVGLTVEIKLCFQISPAQFGVDSLVPSIHHDPRHRGSLILFSNAYLEYKKPGAVCNFLGSQYGVFAWHPNEDRFRMFI